MTRSLGLAAASLAALVVASAADAKPYPVNACVGAKQKADARCGGKILDAAATKCGALLDAEGTFIKELSQDTQGADRDAAEAKARARFAAAFGRQETCPTQATAAGVESAVDGIVADI